MFGIIAASRLRNQLPLASGGIEDFVVIEGEVYKRHTFLSSSNLDILKKGEFEFVLVAGGGAGGTSTNNIRGAGGGGAGGYIENTQNFITGNYPITIGQGGNFIDVNPWTGENGQNSIFSSFTAIGGGGGGRGENGSVVTTGSDGGSGGGGGAELGSGGLGTLGQGFDGGTHSGVSLRRGASGGGGASQVGGAGGSLLAGSGGAGKYTKILQKRIAGGGGGGAGTTSISSLGYGVDGGGDGADSVAKISQAGQPNTGGGGGGGYSTDPLRGVGSNGGSGIFAVVYKTGLVLSPTQVLQTKVYNVTTLSALSSFQASFDNAVQANSKILIMVTSNQIRSSNVLEGTRIQASIGANFPGGVWYVEDLSNNYTIQNTSNDTSSVRVIMVELSNVSTAFGIGTQVLSSTSIDSTSTDVDNQEMILVFTHKSVSDPFSATNSFNELVQTNQLSLFNRLYNSNELNQFTTLSYTGTANTIRQFTIKVLPKYNP